MPTPREAIESANQKFMNTFARGDAAGLAELYTDDGMVMPAGSDLFRGREAVRGFWQGALDSGIKAAKLETVELDAEDDTAVELGRYTLSGDGGATLDRGKYLVVWKRMDGGDWQLHRDIWTTNGEAK